MSLQAEPDTVTMQTRYGELSAPRDDLIGRFLARYGEWAQLEIEFVAAVIGGKPARVADIGAFIGTFGIGLSQLVPLARLCCVEANPAITPLLRKNVRRHAKAPAEVVEALVGPAGFAVTLGNQYPGNLGSNHFAPVAEVEAGAGATPAITLAALSATQGGFDLVKIDAEGMEGPILDSAGDLLRQPDAPVLWLECNHELRSLSVADRLLQAGMTLSYFAFPSFNPRNHLGDPTPIWPFAYEAGLLATPPGRPVPSLPPGLKALDCLFWPIPNLAALRVAMYRTPRWGEADWHGQPLPVVVALAGHACQQESLEDFLEHGQRSRLDFTRQARALNDALARAERAEAALAQEAGLALERLAELTALRERLAELEARTPPAVITPPLPVAPPVNLAAAVRLQAIESSTWWRLGKPVRRVVGAIPGLRPVLRGGLRLGRRLFR